MAAEVRAERSTMAAVEGVERLSLAKGAVEARSKLAMGVGVEHYSMGEEVVVELALLVAVAVEERCWMVAEVAREHSWPGEVELALSAAVTAEGRCSMAKQAVVERCWAVEVEHDLLAAEGVERCSLAKEVVPAR
jgi:hypothetical protein